MADRNERDDLYTSELDRRAATVGTAAAQRQTASQLQMAEQTRLEEAARIQRQTVGAYMQKCINVLKVKWLVVVWQEQLQDLQEVWLHNVLLN